MYLIHYVWRTYLNTYSNNSYEKCIYKQKGGIRIFREIEDKNFFLVGLSSKAVFYLKKTKDLRDILLY
jgi:hypothetical protein